MKFPHAFNFTVNKIANNSTSLSFKTAYEVGGRHRADKGEAVENGHIKIICMH